MAPVDLKLKIILDSKDLSGLPDQVRKAHQKVQAENDKAANKALGDLEKHEKSRIAMMRNSIALEEKREKQRAADMERNSRKTLAQTKSTSDAVIRLENQAAQAQAQLVLDKFERRIALERVKHAQILVDLKGNNAAVEAETRRHNAVVARVRMDQGNFANTPFQKMLENFNKLNNSLGKFGPAMTTVAGSAGSAGAAMSGFGGAISSLAMGPVGIAIAAITALDAGINKLIGNADRAATLRADFEKTISDPAKLDQMVKAMERFEAAKGKRGAVAVNASKDLQAISGNSADQLKDMGLDLTGLKRLQEAQNKRLEFRRIHNDDSKRLDEDLARARVDLLENETARQMSAEENRYNAQKTAVAGHNENTAKNETLHALTIQKIQRDASVKAQEEEDERLEAVAAINAAARDAAFEKEQKRREDARRVSKVQVDEEEKAEAARKTAREKTASAAASLAGVQAEDPIARLEAQHAKELSEYEGFKAAQASIDEKYRILKEQARQQERDRSIAAAQQTFAGFAALAATANMKDRQNRIRHKALLIAEATANTALGATKALGAAPPPFNFALMAGVIAAGAAQVINIKNQKYARGTDYAPGGMALVGEEGPEMMYVPRGAQIKTARETRDIIGGGGGFTHRGNVNLSLVLPAGTSTAQAESLGAAVAGGYQAEMKKWAQLKRDVEYMGVRP